MDGKEAARSGDPWVNQRTGEVADLHAVPTRRRQTHPYAYAWHVVSDGEWQAALRYLRTPGQKVVFATLPLVMKHGNWIMATQMQIARQAGLRQPTVSLAMRALEAQWVVAEIDGGRQFSPHIAWRGTTAGLREAIARWDEVRAEEWLPALRSSPS